MRPVTVLISWAHQDPGWTREQIDIRREDVLRLAATLRGYGIDADVDLFHSNVDWTRWGPARVRDVDVVLIVISSAWSDAWEGRGDLTRNVGAAAEADVLRSIAASSRDALQNKCRLIQFDGASSADIPDGLHGIARYRIESFDVEGPGGLEALLRDLTGQPLHPAPPLGAVPVLPSVLTDFNNPQRPNEPGVRPGSGDGGSVTALDDERRTQLQSQLAALPTPQPGDGPALAWFREWERVQRELGDLNRWSSAPNTEQQDHSGEAASYASLPWASVDNVNVEWHEGRNRDSVYRSFGDYASVYVHLILVPARRFPARVFAQVTAQLPALVRDRAVVPPTAGLDVQEGSDATTVSLVTERAYFSNSVVEGGFRGLRLLSSGAGTAWAELPRDTMGAVLDRDRLVADIDECIELAAAGLEAVGANPGQQVAIAAEVTPVAGITDGTVADLGRRSSASLRGALGRGPVAMNPEEALPLRVFLGDRRLEVAETVAVLLLREWAQL